MEELHRGQSSAYNLEELVVTLRIRSLLLIIAALVVVAGLATWALRSHSGTTRSSGAFTLVTAPPFSASTERIGGCGESRLDHGRDHDPAGFTDQEDDECISSWNVHRQPDGAPITAGDHGG
jgi:hypothetical protein